VAVYAETAAIGEGKQLRLHYAPMIDPAMIALALGGKEAKFWVPPTEAREKEPPKHNSNGSQAR
jgi:hypothetical protein